MKIVYTLISLLVVHTCFAQPTSREVRETRNLDAYTGIWEYATPTDTFRIVLKKGMQQSMPNSTNECLIGGYRYMKQGSLIGDYTKGTIPSQFLDKDWYCDDETITVMADNAKINPEWIDPNQLYVFFKDIELGKTDGNGKIQLLSPTQIRWTLEDSEGCYDINVGEGETMEIPPAGFSVPTDVIMEKISNTVGPELPPRP